MAARELVFCMSHVLKSALLNQEPSLSRTDACSRETNLMAPFPWAVVLMTFFYGVALGSGFRRFCATPLGNLLLNALYPPSAYEPSKREKTTRYNRARKFVSSLLELVIYTAFFVVGAILLAQQTWIWPSSEWWADSPSSEMPTELAFIYIAYASRYMCQFTFVFLDPRKSDFVEMQAHHTVTVSLVCLSYAYRMVRIGVLIMVVFDFADPFLHVAKLVTYCKEASPPTSRTRRVLATVADIFFALFALAFLLTRIVLFSYLVYSVSYESFLYMSPSRTFKGGLLGEVSPATHVCVLLVWAIYGLQWFWFNLLLKVIAKALRGDELKDERSDGSASDADEVAKRQFKVDKTD